MAEYEQVSSQRVFMGKLNYGSDLLQELTDVCVDRNVKLGRIEAIGAVQKARIAFYNQKDQTFQFFTLDFPMEIAHLIGNVSLKNGEPFVHAHVTLVDEKGKSYGGHLEPGTVVFACEFVLEVFDGPRFDRNPDEETGLSLWSIFND